MILVNQVVFRVIVIVVLSITSGCGNDSAPETITTTALDNNDTGKGSAIEFANLAPMTAPNILFIAIDDLNDWTSSLKGHPGVKTPNLTRIAAMGIEFTNAHTPSPTCLAARASLMTGIRPSTSGVYANQNRPWRKNPMLKDAVTLPRYFSNKGYYALGSGKIFHKPDRDSWDEYWPSFKKTTPSKIRVSKPLAELTGRKRKSLDWGPLDVDFDDTSDGKVTNWAVGKLQDPFKKPFFLAVGLFRPHIPWYVPRKYFEMNPLEQVTLPKVIDDDLDDLSARGHRIAVSEEFTKLIKPQGKWREAVQGYMASISFVDDAIGRILDSLESSKYKNNTIIVLWSDNGLHLGTKNHWHKWDLWEESTRIPLIIVVPGLTTAGRKTDVPVNLIDIYPTLVELAGLPAKSNLEGTSLVPWLVNPDLEKENPSVTSRNQNNHTIRSKHWRYTRYNDGTEELYDHRSDPHEWYNLASIPEHAGKKEELATWFPTINAGASPPPKNLSHLD
jgi:arylsulfatase A-like enzyme